MFSPIPQEKKGEHDKELFTARKRKKRGEPWLSAFCFDDLLL